MRIIQQTLTLALLLVFFMTPALGHEGATGMVKKRMDNMESMKEETLLIADMAKGKRPMNAAQIEQASSKIKKLSKHITLQFPEGSLYRPTNALPAIWKRWQRFEDYAIELTHEAEILSTAMSPLLRELRISSITIFTYSDL